MQYSLLGLGGVPIWISPRESKWLEMALPFAGLECAPMNLAEVGLLITDKNMITMLSINFSCSVPVTALLSYSRNRFSLHLLIYSHLN